MTQDSAPGALGHWDKSERCGTGLEGGTLDMGGWRSQTPSLPGLWTKPASGCAWEAPSQDERTEGLAETRQPGPGGPSERGAGSQGAHGASAPAGSVQCAGRSCRAGRPSETG